MTPTPTAPPGYRPLREGEVIQSGDMWPGPWGGLDDVGLPVIEGRPYASATMPPIFRPIDVTTMPSETKQNAILEALKILCLHYADEAGRGANQIADAEKRVEGNEYLKGIFAQRRAECLGAERAFRNMSVTIAEIYKMVEDDAASPD